MSIIYKVGVYEPYVYSPYDREPFGLALDTIGFITSTPSSPTGFSAFALESSNPSLTPLFPVNDRESILPTLPGINLVASIDGEQQTISVTTTRVYSAFYLYSGTICQNAISDTNTLYSFLVRYNSLLFSVNNRLSYLHLSKSGNYYLAPSQLKVGQKFNTIPDGEDEISVYVGRYGRGVVVNNIDYFDGELICLLEPNNFQYYINSGEKYIYNDEFTLKIVVDGEEFIQPMTRFSSSIRPIGSKGFYITGHTVDGTYYSGRRIDTSETEVGSYQLLFNTNWGTNQAIATIDILSNPNPYNPGGTSTPGGGGGTFDGGPTDDPTIFIPNGTTEDNASLSRIYTRYVLGSSELSIVGNRLWTTDIIHDIVNAIAELFASPFESMISLLSFPFDISSMRGYSAARQLMMWGNVQFISDGLFDVPQTAAVSFDWGEISIESFYDGFLDYAPYTKMELYLPWGTGVVSIDPNECTPGKIRIQSNIELDKGTAGHIVTSEFTRDGRTVKEVLGTYGTVVGKQIPITALDYAGKSHAVASVAVTAGAIALAGGAGAAVSSSAGSLTAGASTTALSTAVSPAQLAPIAATAMPPLMYNAPRSEEFQITPEAIKLATEGINAAMTPGHVARNGSFMTGSAGLLPTTPFLIISRPEQSVPENYGHYYGYPSNIYSKLSDLSGFTQVGSIHLENIVCTEKEREELMTLLQGGVLL